MDNRLKELLQKYLDRTCTDAERDELLDRLRFLPRSEELDVIFEKLWEEKSSESLDLEWDHMEKLHHDRTTQKPDRWKYRILRGAAAAVLIGMIFYFIYPSGSPESEWVVYETGFGETLEITLEDGSQVSLNADSKLSWNKNWKENGVREADLEGEAYFDIAKYNLPDGDDLTIDSISFKVFTEDVSVHVLGTSFNISRRRGRTDVLLDQGSIQLELFGKTDEIRSSRTNKESKEDAESLVNMNPGEFVSYSSSEEKLIRKKLESPKEISDWKRGILSYSGIEFGEMLKNLEDIYGTRLTAEDEELIRTRVHFNMPFENWDMVKEMVERMLNVKIEKIDKQEYVIKPN